MNINLHIGKIVLDGLPVEDSVAAADIQTAVAVELKRLISNGAHPSGLREGRSLASMPSEDIHLAVGETPADIGRQIGRAVYGGMYR